MKIEYKGRTVYLSDINVFFLMRTIKLCMISTKLGSTLRREIKELYEKLDSLIQ